MLSDPDMKELAQEELQQAKADITRLEDELKFLLLPKDPNDERTFLWRSAAARAARKARCSPPTCTACTPCTRINAAGRPRS